MGRFRVYICNSRRDDFWSNKLDTENNQYFDVLVDTNGGRNQNKVGKDYFEFQIDYEGDFIDVTDDAINYVNGTEDDSSDDEQIGNNNNNNNPNWNKKNKKKHRNKNKNRGKNKGGGHDGGGNNHGGGGGNGGGH